MIYNINLYMILCKSTDLNQMLNELKEHLSSKFKTNI